MNVRPAQPVEKNLRIGMQPQRPRLSSGAERMCASAAGANRLYALQASPPGETERMSKARTLEKYNGAIVADSRGRTRQAFFICR